MYMLVTERMVYVAACLRELAVFRLKNYWTRGHRKFLCRCISDMYAFYFVFDVLPYLLYCHITYCLHNIVSGHPVLLLLKIDWLLYFISAECSETSSPFLIPKLMSACVVFFYFPHSDEDLLLQCFDMWLADSNGLQSQPIKTLVPGSQRFFFGWPLGTRPNLE